MTIIQLRDVLNEYIENHKNQIDLPVNIHGNSRDFDANRNNPRYHEQNFLMITDILGEGITISAACSRRSYETFCNDSYRLNDCFVKKYCKEF